MTGCNGRKKPCCMPLAASCLQAQLCSEFPGHGPAPTCVRHTLHKVALSFRVFRYHLLPFLLLFLLPLDCCCCCSSRLGLLLAILPCSCRRRLRWRRVATLLLLSWRLDIHACRVVASWPGVCVHRRRRRSRRCSRCLSGSRRCWLAVPGCSSLGRLGGRFRGGLGRVGLAAQHAQAAQDSDHNVHTICRQAGMGGGARPWILEPAPLAATGGQYTQ